MYQDMIGRFQQSLHIHTENLIIVKSIDTIQVGHTYVYLFIIIRLQHPHNELFDVFELVGGILGQHKYRYKYHTKV